MLALITHTWQNLYTYLLSKHTTLILMVYMLTWHEGLLNPCIDTNTHTHTHTYTHKHTHHTHTHTQTHTHTHTYTHFSHLYCVDVFCAYSVSAVRCLSTTVAISSSRLCMALEETGHGSAKPATPG